MEWMKRKNQKVQREKEAKDELEKQRRELELIKSEVCIQENKKKLRKELGVVDGKKVKSRVFETEEERIARLGI